MPFDPRPVSEGGNRGIDEEFSRKAPPGKFRVIGVDTFDGGDWLENDFDTQEAAFAHVADKVKDQQMLMMHVYDDQGKHIHRGGSF